MKKIAFLMLSLMALFSCQKKAESSAMVYNIDGAESVEAELSSVKYVPLETSEEALVGNIKKMLYQNNLFYLFDDALESILIFREDGSLVQSVNRKGSGPGEYVMAMDIDVDAEGNLYVSDAGRQCIMVYSGEDYQAYKEIQVGSPFVEFIVEDEQSVYLAGVAREGEINVNLAHLDVQSGALELLEESQYENEYSTLRFAPQSLFRTDYGLFYFSHLKHQILSLHDGEVVEHVTFASERWPSAEVMESWQSKNPIEILRDRTFIHDLSAYFETKNKIFAQLTAIPPISVLADKQTGMCSILGKMADDSFPITPRVNACSDGSFVTWCAPTKQNIDKILQSEALDDGTKRKLLALDEEANPIVIVYKMK